MTILVHWLSHNKIDISGDPVSLSKVSLLIRSGSHTMDDKPLIHYKCHGEEKEGTTHFVYECTQGNDVLELLCLFSGLVGECRFAEKRPPASPNRESSIRFFDGHSNPGGETVNLSILDCLTEEELSALTPEEFVQLQASDNRDNTTVLHQK